MKVRFKTTEEALSAKEKAEKSLENIKKILKNDKDMGWSNKDGCHLLFLSILRRDRALLAKINAWQEDQERRLVNGKKEQFVKKCKWSPTSLRNQLEIRRARRDKREYTETLFTEWSQNYDFDRNFDPFMHALECSECDRENDFLAEDRIAFYNDQNNYHPYQSVHERDLLIQSSGAYDGPEIQEEDKCYECGGPCVVYREECSSLYDVNNDMREQDYPCDRDDDFCSDNDDAFDLNHHDLDIEMYGSIHNL
jgi:hypothetical protein